MKLYIVIGGQLDYGDSGRKVIGVFDDEAVANDVSRTAMAAFDFTNITTVDLNAVRWHAAREIIHYRKYIQRSSA